MLKAVGKLKQCEALNFMQEAATKPTDSTMDFSKAWKQALTAERDCLKEMVCKVSAFEVRTQKYGYGVVVNFTLSI